ncbi:glutamate-5-semialdehyde dehydrogenase [Haematomicrobium sanguinis]|uniref:glutamate-5-semialdehyde dehydrogenase n=1 Tax=Haematomicrobium sanguinis TaxID=479106 RepID=UPI00047C83F2|nr:glutamate-5-semialdehyde dehydrogenase [Haematomicrobium sanguinis]
MSADIQDTASETDLENTASEPGSPETLEPTLTPQEGITQLGQRAKKASRKLARATRAWKDRALTEMAEQLLAKTDQILAANQRDLERAEQNGVAAPLIQRLTLTKAKIADLADALRELAGLPDPVGQVVRGQTLPNGLRLRQMRVPMGVIAAIYEARPNVTVDIAGLAIKSGNAAILRGGSAAEETNKVLVSILRDALHAVGLPEDAIISADKYGREGAGALMKARGLVDVLIPRGGHDLIQTVVTESTVPVIETGEGNVHIFIDKTANAEQATEILLNAKTQKPSVCNTVETLLIHKDAVTQGEGVLRALARAAVVLHADERAQALIPDLETQPATEEDWATEYLDLHLAVKVVDDLDEALEHIRTWTTGHTEAILTNDLANADRFVAELDSAAVIVNASTRFTDGGELGLGAEVGISTQKLHARGPMGLAELTTTKWVVHGDGQVRG